MSSYAAKVCTIIQISRTSNVFLEMLIWSFHFNVDIFDLKPVIMNRNTLQTLSDVSKVQVDLV